MKIKNKKFKFNDYKFGEMYPKFGIIATHFLPFDEVRERDLTDEDDIKDLLSYQLSTVYNGIRYFFETPEQLKVFCEMVEA
jgi:hypothetical protein